MSVGLASIDKRIARGILYEEAAKGAAGRIDPTWSQPIEHLSEAATGKSLTHIAFLGTAILAKCVDHDVDVFAVKTSAGPGAYSARGLCHGVLVPNAPELDISLGVTGREPLNNQPYFRIERLTRDAPVRSTGRGVLNLLCDILDRLQAASDEQARQAMRAFIDVRRRLGTRYSRSLEERVNVSVDQVIDAIEALVGAGSEGGRTAQAVVAGLLDVLAGADRVDARRVNDPSRTVPADVNVRAAAGEGWERAFEVRDKPVSREDLYLLVSKCAEAGVGEAVMVAIAPAPEIKLVGEAQAWAAERGVNLILFSDWSTLVRQALHWAPTPTLVAASLLPGQVEQRLIEVEASPEALAQWEQLFSAPDEPPQAAGAASL
jgi:hypothetical protein